MEWMEINGNCVGFLAGTVYTALHYTIFNTYIHTGGQTVCFIRLIKDASVAPANTAL